MLVHNSLILFYFLILLCRCCFLPIFSLLFPFASICSPPEPGASEPLSRAPPEGTPAGMRHILLRPGKPRGFRCCRRSTLSPFPTWGPSAANCRLRTPAGGSPLRKSPTGSGQTPPHNHAAEEARVRERKALGLSCWRNCPSRLCLRGHVEPTFARCWGPAGTRGPEGVLPCVCCIPRGSLGKCGVRQGPAPVR